MKYQPSGTIKSFLSIPQMKPINIGALDVAALAPKVKTYWDLVQQTSDCAYPETDAIEFYVLNHLVSVIRNKFDANEVLPDWAQNIMRLYVEVLAAQSQRVYSYLILITTRESRHLKNPSVAMKNCAMSHKTFHATLKGSGSTGAAEAFCNHPPACDLGPYVGGLTHLFNHGSFSGGYGGPKWGHIAECLRKMVYGETSLEIMVDTAYTLAHNNGPMFNKGMLYHMYSGHTLLKILDIQRAGQMPEAVMNSELPVKFITQRVKSAVATVKAVYESEFGSYVDWHKVESLGAVGKYSTEKSNMPKMVAPPVPEMIGSKKALPTGGTFDIMPGMTVNILKRIA